MNQITCKYCHAMFTPSRIDMKFCRTKCRHDYKNRRVKYEGLLKEKEENLVKLRAESEEIKEKLSKYTKRKKVEEQHIKELEELEAKFKNGYKKLLKATDEQVYQYICEQKIKKETDPIEKEGLRDSLRFCEDELKQEIVNDYRQGKAEQLKKIQEREKERLLMFPIFFKDFTTISYEGEIDKIKEQISALEQTELKLQLPSPPQKEPKNKQSRKERLESLKNSTPSIELGGAEVRKMKFDSYLLSGELGRFFGELDQNKVAFALTGDSGAGKSYFSFELAKLFLNNRKTVKYFSLEEGIGKLTREKLNLFQIGNEMKITANGTLEDIEQDAERFDVIIVDSFTKLTRDQKEFDLLRHSHPKTLFIMIFQKTTAKTMVGGAAIKYDSSATIDVKMEGKERVAIMEKGRYGTQGWIYSITQGKIIYET